MSIKLTLETNPKNKIKKPAAKEIATCKCSNVSMRSTLSNSEKAKNKKGQTKIKLKLVW